MLENNLSINLIYGHRPGQRNKGTLDFMAPPAYYVIRLFSDIGDIQLDLVKSSYFHITKSKLSEDSDLLGPFEDLEQLKNFISHLCRELQSPEAYLLSVETYNQVIKTTQNIRQFKKMFAHYGERYDNPDFYVKNKSFLRRIFKDH